VTRIDGLLDELIELGIAVAAVICFVNRAGNKLLSHARRRRILAPVQHGGFKLVLARTILEKVEFKRFWYDLNAEGLELVLDYGRRTDPHIARAGYQQPELKSLATSIENAIPVGVPPA